MRFLFLFLLSFNSAIAVAELRPYNYTKQVRTLRKSMSDLDQAELATKTDGAIEQMIETAAAQLRKVKHNDTANRIQGDYDEKFQGYVSKLVEERIKGLGDIGDHRPLAEWLTTLYNDLLAILGPEVMALTHLEDIRVINYTIPVVFHMQGLTPQEINAGEYAKHWTPFWGVVSYWTVWGVCTGVTYGSGWFIVCTPAGMAAKYVVINYIASKFSDNGYEFFYGSNLRLPGHMMEDRIGCIGPNVLDLCKL